MGILVLSHAVVSLSFRHWAAVMITNIDTDLLRPERAKYQLTWHLLVSLLTFAVHLTIWHTRRLSTETQTTSQTCDCSVPLPKSEL